MDRKQNVAFWMSISILIIISGLLCTAFLITNFKLRKYQFSNRLEKLTRPITILAQSPDCVLLEDASGTIVTLGADDPVGSAIIHTFVPGQTITPRGAIRQDIKLKIATESWEHGWNSCMFWIKHDRKIDIDKDDNERMREYHLREFISEIKPKEPDNRRK